MIQPGDEWGEEHVAVLPSQHHGRGLFSKRAFAPGEVSPSSQPVAERGKPVSIQF